MNSLCSASPEPQSHFIPHLATISSILYFVEGGPMVAISPHLSFRRYIAVESMSGLMRDRLWESDWIFSGMKTYNRRYLNAEYNCANASAEMAGRWESFEKDEDRYLLQYRTQNDGAVRPEHAELHGITLPASDSFWDTCYPPNGWNCRCTVVQVLKDKYQETDHNEAMRLGGEAMSKDSKGMFAFNPGKQEKVFPDYNPYTISRCKNCPKTQGNLASGVPDNQLCEACGIVRGHSNKEDNYYADQKYGNRLKISQSADISELPLNVDAARDLLSSFPEYSIKILAHSTEKGVKNPEYLINDLVADRKGIEGYNGIISGFKKAIKQGCQAVYIDMDAHMSSEPLREILLSIKLEGRRKDFQTGIIQKCFIRHNGKVVEIGSDYFEGTQDEIRAGIRDVLQKLKR